MDALRASGKSPEFAAVKADEATSTFPRDVDIPFVICREISIEI